MFKHINLWETLQTQATALSPKDLNPFNCIYLFICACLCLSVSVCGVLLVLWAPSPVDQNLGEPHRSPEICYPRHGLKST